MINLNNILNQVPQYKEFLKVNELNKNSKILAEKHFDIVKLVKLGNSVNNKPIYMLKIGSGKRKAILFGFPHPNEPVGSLTIETLANILINNEKLRNQLNFTWYLIKCADPDGASLNEGWFKGKFTAEKYSLNFYRPPAFKQIEWTFPVKYKDYLWNKPTKETLILKKLIDKIKPDLIYPLHNSGFSGAYFFVSKNFGKKFLDSLINLTKKLNIPLHLGEPEISFMKEYKKPIYHMFGFVDYYNYMKNHGQDPNKVLKCGTSTVDYAQKINSNTFGLITEIPYLFNDKIFNKTKIDKTRRECNLIKLENAKRTNEFIENKFKNYHDTCNKKSPFYLNTKWIIKKIRLLIKTEEKEISYPKYKRKATIAEEFDCTVGNNFNDCTKLGQFFRLAKESNLNNLQQEILNKIKNKSKYIDKECKTLPVTNLVKLQIGALFISIKYLNNKKKT